MPTALPRLGRFTLTRFRPPVYVTYGVLWPLALEASAVRLDTGSWRPSAASAVRAGSVVLALLFLRMLDELKDLGYDRVHHPDRPLVTGAITAPELRAAMTAITIVVTLLNAFLSPVAVASVLAALGYGIFLAWLENRVAAVRDGLLVSLLVSYPAQLLLSLYVYFSLAASGTIALHWQGIPLILAFAGVFLHFEFARKTCWHNDPGERSYSAVLGPVRSAAIAVGFAAGAVVLILVLFQPWRGSWLEWAPLAMLGFPLYGAARFLRRAAESWPLWTAMAFVLGSYLTLLALV
jgi:hypothetical protein